MAGGKNGQTLFVGSFWYRRGITSTAATDRHLKVKDIEYNVWLTKNYCITASMQKMSSIHTFIQQILGSREQNDHTHFWPGPTKNQRNKF